MEFAHLIKVVAPDGAVGVIDTRNCRLDGSCDPVAVQFPDGRQIMVPFANLIRQSDGEYAMASPLPAGSPTPDQPPLTIPVMQEQVTVGKRTVETGRVRVSKTVHEEEEVIDPPLLRTDVVIEHVPINRPVDSLPAVRQEGQTTIVPVVEETLVVEKRLVLREELRITRHTGEYHDPQRVTLRREEANVQRLAGQQQEKSFGENPPEGMDIATPS
ncbi:MAG: YsnF/AvaK domain-containing protein [Bacillota bacterium]